jgi:hypothetical protein
MSARSMKIGDIRVRLKWLTPRKVSMRLAYCVFFLLSACASHVVRCDGRLQPINLPARPVATAPAAMPDVAPGKSP